MNFVFLEQIRILRVQDEAITTPILCGFYVETGSTAINAMSNIQEDQVDEPDFKYLSNSLLSY